MKNYNYSPRSKRFVKCKHICLSEREKQVLALPASGHSSGQIAEIVFIDLNTVKYHKKNIYRKLGVNSCAEAIYYAFCNKMV